ncbi:MAG: exo-alpha-sialidase [Aggregatilineales bacterium]
MASDTLARWMIDEIGTLDRFSFVTGLPQFSERAFTVAFWYMATTANRTQVMVSSENWFQVRLADGMIAVEVATINGSPSTLSAPQPTLDEWHHVTVVVGDTLAIYVDGKLAKEIHLPDSVQIPRNSALCIGGYTDPAGGHFDHTFGRNQAGWIDDVRWYDRALGSEEIVTLIPNDAESSNLEFVAKIDATGTADFTAIADDPNVFRAFLWDFGDKSSGLGASVSHDYPFAGKYQVQLTAITQDYQTVTLEQSVVITGKSEPLTITPVFINGIEGYACYRIPAIVRATNGDLVAFAEARLESCSDSTSTIHMVCKRSHDHGKSWSPLAVVARNIVDGHEHVVQNGSPVVDTVRGTGRIILLYNKMEHSEWELSDGVGISRIFSIVSDDSGATWHSETDISKQVHRPSEWRVQRPTLGHAIQLRTGRLFYSGVFTDIGHSVFQSQNYAFWSDDLGESWTIGGIVPEIGLNEATSVELENGDVMINSRAYIDEKSVGYRAVTIGQFVDESTIEFEPTRHDKALIDPAVQASIVRYTTSDQVEYGGKSRLLFSNPNDPQARFNLTVRLSYDEGKTWAVSKSIDSGPSAYSDLVVQDDMHIGVLYERGNHGGIAYRNFTLDWLTDGRDSIGETR